MRATLRPLLLIWLVWHLFVMGVDLSKHVSRSLAAGSALQRSLAVVADLRDYTEWYQWRIGVHQNWSMFIPNPRTSTSWLEVEGITLDKQRVALPLIVGEPDPEGWLLTYPRAGKHERNAVAGHRKRLRAAYTRHYCRVNKEAGRPLRGIDFYAVSYRTPPPEQRGARPRSEWPRTRRKLGGWNCKR
jgi:hypothetical protein